MTLAGFFDALYQRWLVVLVTALAGILAALAITAAMPKIYESEAKSIVTVANPGSDANQVYQTGQFVSDRVKSYTLLADSPDVLKPVIQRMGLNTDPETLSRKVTLVNPLDTTFLVVRAVDEDPVIASEVANEVSKQLAVVIEFLETPAGRSAPVRVTLTTPAAEPTEPITPKAWLNVALGFLVGLALGISLALIRENRDTTVRGRDDLIDLTGHPPLAAVPDDAKSFQAVGPLAVLDSSSPEAEAFRTLRSNLRFVNVDDPPRVLLMTSALPGEGRTTTARHLAVALVQSGYRVCLVDADLRRPKIAETLGIDSQVGLTDVLVGGVALDEALAQWNRIDLRVLPAGTIPSDPPTLLGSEQMADLVATLRANFDYVIIDSPPALVVSDAIALVGLTDGAVQVVRSGRTDRADALASLDALKAVGARVVGTVLTFQARNDQITREENSQLTAPRRRWWSSPGEHGSGRSRTRQRS